jgi:hypothetical protein
MTLRTPVLAIVMSLACTASLAVASCATEDPPTAVVDNQYPTTSDGDGGTLPGVVVYKTWWTTTLFDEPVSPGSQSDPQRTVFNTDYAYAILAPNWDPSSGAAPDPTTLIPVRSAAPLTVSRGGTLDIAISDASFVGRCTAGKALSQDDADIITQRIFPGDFATIRYDAATCAATPLIDGGTDSGDAQDSSL